MPDPLKSWFKENQTLVVFLIAQLIAFGAAGISIITYYVRMETRVSIMETRGAEYTVARLNTLEQRITVMEGKIETGLDRLERVVTELLKRPSPPPP